MAPAYAMEEMLERTNHKLNSFDFYEIHEAFGTQVCSTLKYWEDDKISKKVPLGKVDREKINLKGGSIALGHPFAATGARIMMTLAKQLNEKNDSKGLISVCAAQGLGITAIMKSV